MLTAFYTILMLSDLAARAATPIAYDDIPKVITSWWLDPADVESISSFRSCAGHPYPPDVCASLKHYFEWKPEVKLPKLFAPCNGTVSLIRNEERGVQFEITPDAAPEYRVVLFHARPMDGETFKVGQRLIAGNQIGTQWTTETNSDLAFYLFKNHTYLPGFYAMNDSLLKQCDMLLDDFVISEKDREEWPCGCTGPNDPMKPAKGGLLDWTKVDCHLFSKPQVRIKLTRQGEKEQRRRQEKSSQHGHHLRGKGR